MKSIKFTSVKLIIHFLILILVSQLFPPAIHANAQAFALQVAASKTPMDIQYFSKKYKITEPISETRGDGWYRYLVGNFPDLSSASEFAGAFASRTGLSGVFPRKLENQPDSISQKQQADTAIQVAEPVANPPITDTIQAQVEKTTVSPEPTPVVRKSARKKGDISNYIFLKIIGIKNAAELRNDLISYGNSHLPLITRKLYIRIVERIYNYPIILLFISLILFFLLNIILVLLVLYYSNKQKNRKDRYVRIYKTLYEQVLCSYLFEEINWETTLLKLKRNKTPMNRKILTSVLLNFQENLRGEMDSRIPEIYVKLELHKDSLKAVKSSYYDNKVRGISELTNLYPKGAENIIQNYINHANVLVSAEAQASYIRLHPERPFDFLRRLTSPFTQWTQLTAFYLYRLHQMVVPSFSDYLNSEHPTVRNFCLKMIIHFQQLENASEIFRLVDSPMELTRFLALRAINDLRLYDGKELIKARFASETDKNRIEIIKAFKNLGTGEDIDFLETIIKTGSVSEKTEACRSLYFMSNEGVERLTLLSRNPGLKIEDYLAHVKDPRN